LVGEGSEPYQVVIGPDGDTAYVVLRKDQKLVKIDKLHTAPSVYGSVATGSEPSSLALGPSGRYVYVANWNDGTLSEIETGKLEWKSTIDLNAALVKTGYLGDIKARAALAHPRSLIISNDHDGSDDDESIYVTEYYGQQVEAELADGSNSDTRKVGIVYKVPLESREVKTIDLKALTDIGFLDNAGFAAGCYPNQLQSIALNGDYAYVVSVCASPKGPLGTKATTTSCSVKEDCDGMNLVEPACVTPFAGAANAICVDVSSVKTSTAPVVSIIDTRVDREVPGGAENLNAAFAKLFTEQKTPDAGQRYPLFANDLAFVAGSTVGYVTANGIDAVFRFQVDAKAGTLGDVGGSTNPFIDLFTGFAADKAGKNPIGIAIGSSNKKFALVANDVSRNVSLLDFNTQSVSGAPMAPVVLQTAALPTTGSDADKVLRGKRFFDTGSARWSLRGQGWGACQSCHGDGQTDNVTWYFARGPRQATALDGSFASKHPEDQRIFNWTAIFDEVDDFEGNTRDISGGVGAIVSALSMPPKTDDRIDFAGLGQAGLNGSSSQAADPANPLSFAAAPKLADWSDITKYLQSIRSPRAPTNLDASQVQAGQELFNTYGACQGCHGGEKWTVSRRFYTPSTGVNTALKTAQLTAPAAFPMALLPATLQANQLLRFGGPNPAVFDQILCAIRPVGTFKVAESGVGIAELRADMTTVAQGDGNPAGEGRGYNVPSLLGVASGAPYFHAGSARTLEAVFSSTFQTHFRALAPNLLTESDSAVVQGNIDALVQYLLSIDESTKFPELPDPGAAGGSLCPTTFP
jgi:mono/diheme cytochrome c family protein